MKYTIRYDADIDACIITVTGLHRRPHDSHKLLCEAAAAAKEYGCSRFLFDMRKAKITGGILGAFETAKEPGKYGFSRSNCIGAVYPAITEEHQFMENVGVNRGASAFRIFDDIDKARAWITTR